MHPAARRQARTLELATAEKAWAKEQANKPLREDVAAALEAEHAIAIGRDRAQAQYNEELVDAAHEAMRAPEPRQLYRAERR